MSITRARDLRRNETDAERKLWNAIRDHQLDGIKFRRQVPIGRYIADFASFRPRVVIELDGGQHAEQLRYDEACTRALAAQGYRLLRFWNNDVNDNLAGVLAAISDALHE